MIDGLAKIKQLSKQEESCYEAQSISVHWLFSVTYGCLTNVEKISTTRPIMWLLDSCSLKLVHFMMKAFIINL